MRRTLAGRRGHRAVFRADAHDLLGLDLAGADRRRGDLRARPGRVPALAAGAAGGAAAARAGAAGLLRHRRLPARERDRGFIPGRHTWSALEAMRAEAAEQIRINSSPLDSTPVLRLGVVPALALVAAIVDAYAVVRRAPALAGIPLLALFTICGATAGNSVGWFDFAVAAAGFLVILSADSRVSLLGWGRLVPRRHGDTVTRPRLGLSGRRVGVAAVVLAVLVPAVLPGLSGNRLADAFHSGQGAGAGLSPFASLQGPAQPGQGRQPGHGDHQGRPGQPRRSTCARRCSAGSPQSGWQSDAEPAAIAAGPGLLRPAAWRGRRHGQLHSRHHHHRAEGRRRARCSRVRPP